MFDALTDAIRNCVAQTPSYHSREGEMIKLTVYSHFLSENDQAGGRGGLPSLQDAPAAVRVSDGETRPTVRLSLA